MYVHVEQLLRQLLRPGLGSKEAAAPRSLRRKLLAHTVAIIEMENNFVFSSSDIFLFMQALPCPNLSLSLSLSLTNTRFELVRHYPLVRVWAAMRLPLALFRLLSPLAFPLQQR